MSAVVLLVGIALLGLPAVVRGLGVRLPPAEWARLCAFALGAGVLLVHAALATAAALSVLMVFGGDPLSAVLGDLTGHLAPGGRPVGLAALALGSTQLVLIARAASRVRALRRMARVEGAVGSRRPAGEFELVVLPVSQPVAASSPAGGGQIIVTEGLLRCLRREEAAAVVRHEEAHLRHRHHRLLALAVVAEAAVPARLTRSVTALLRTSVERWADEDAAGSPRDRLVLGSAIAQVRARMRGAGHELDERLKGLSEVTPPAGRAATRALVVVPALALVLVAVVSLGDWAGHMHTALISAGLWPLSS